MKNKKLVIFGPWCGEFCYELSWWIPEIRKQRYTTYNDYDSIAVSARGRGVLYNDFTTGFVGYGNDLSDTLKYPATYGEHINGRDVIPENLQIYIKRLADQYRHIYDHVEIYMPGQMPITRERVMSELPYGLYKHYDASPRVKELIKNKINFNNNLQTVAVMARIRTRHGKTCYLDWNPEHWKTFIELLINDLHVNVVMIGIEQKPGSSAGASLVFSDSENIKSIIFKGEDSVEEQIALLKQTKCSIYGASGTAVFPFFTQTPTFTQQTIEEGFRLKFQWERDLTNNLENIEIFDKYHNNEIYNSPPLELYAAFKKFYQTLG